MELFNNVGLLAENKQKGPVINRAPSRASRASLANEGFFFGQRPRPAVLTGLPLTVREAAAALPAAVGSIDDSGSLQRWRRQSAAAAALWMCLMFD
jgi:hypothetical protein